MLAQSKLDAKRGELNEDYAQFETSLVENKNTLENDLVKQAPLFKDALQAKFSQA